MDKYSTKYLNNTFQNCHDYWKQGKTEKIPKFGGDSGDMMTNKSDIQKLNGDMTGNYM